MSALWDILLTASFWAAAVRIATPLIFATMGELICERAGVLNLGIEGIMVIGAFTGWIAVWAGLPLWWGVAAAMAAGMGFGLLHGVLCVPFGLSQHVVGLGGHPAGHLDRVLRLSPDPAAGHQPAPDRTLCRLAGPGPVRYPADRRGVFLPRRR